MQEETRVSMGKAQIKNAARQADEDYVLVTQAQRRGPAAREAFGRLTLKYQDRIYNALLKLLPNREDALDLAQETFLKAFEGLKGFKGKSKFSTWLWTIALNLRTSKWRAKRASPVTEGLSVDSSRADDAQTGLPKIAPVAPDKGPAHRVEAEELNKIVEDEIHALPMDYRRVLVLRDVQGLEYGEIGRALKLPEGTVKSRLHRARLELRTRLDKYL